MDGFTNRPNGLRKIIYIVMRRDIAGLKMNRSNQMIIAGDETIENLCQKFALFHAKSASDTKINSDQIALHIEK